MKRLFGEKDSGGVKHHQSLTSPLNHEPYAFPEELVLNRILILAVVVLISVFEAQTQVVGGTIGGTVTDATEPPWRASS